MLLRMFYARLFGVDGDRMIQGREREAEIKLDPLTINEPPERLTIMADEGWTRCGNTYQEKVRVAFSSSAVKTGGFQTSGIQPHSFGAARSP